jgi:hypothetical protein
MGGKLDQAMPLDSVPETGIASPFFDASCVSDRQSAVSFHRLNP